MSEDPRTAADSDEPVSKNLRIPGAITYMHMPSRDKRESAEFYRRVFDWYIDESWGSFEDKSGRLRGSWATHIPVASLGGMMLFIYVEDVDRTLESVAAHGGEIVAPAFKEGQLNVAKFHDPSGNLLGIWNGPGA